MASSGLCLLTLCLCTILATPSRGFLFSGSDSCSGPVTSTYPFNLNVAKRMMRFSAVAYVDDHDRLRHWQCDLCVQRLQGFQVDGIVHNGDLRVLAYVGYDSSLRAIVVAFRGSELNIANWLRVNADILRDRPSTIGRSIGKVHGGFNDAYKTLQSGVRHHVRRMKALHAGAPVYVTGHSLGGAMATLCALDLHLNNIHRDPIMINFGSPRVGNKCFVHAYTQNVRNSIRAVHPGDPVTKLPPEFLGYRHVARKVFDKSSNSHVQYYGQHGTDERR